MQEQIHDIVYNFAVEIKRLLGDKLSKVILYGSYARGDFDKNSDIDVMILVKLPQEEIAKIKTQIYDMAYDIEMENDFDIQLSPIVKSEEHFEYWVDTLPFYRNVRNEGVEING